MDKSLELYLDTVDQYLRPITATERMDIIKEISSCMLELENTEGLTPEEIIGRLGNPKNMAQSYLGDLIVQNNKFSWSKLLKIIAFYWVAGLSGIVVIPTLAIFAPTFLFCGILSPILGLVKFLGYLMHYDIPFILFEFGPLTLHPAQGFLLSVLFGVGFLILGRILWKLLLCYIHVISQKKRDWQV